MERKLIKTEERLTPYTIEELRAGILESEKQFAEGRFKTIEEVFEGLGERTIEISDLWDCRRNPDALVAQLVS